MNIDYPFESLGPTLRYVVLVFLLIAALVAIAVVVGLAALPGQIAKQRMHPQKEAINICGWLGIPTGVLWVIAMVWAYSRSNENKNSATETASDLESLSKKIDGLEKTISIIETQLDGAKS